MDFGRKLPRQLKEISRTARPTTPKFHQQLYMTALTIPSPSAMPRNSSGSNSGADIDLLTSPSPTQRRQFEYFNPLATLSPTLTQALEASTPRGTTSHFNFPSLPDDLKHQQRRASVPNSGTKRRSEDQRSPMPERPLVGQSLSSLKATKLNPPSPLLVDATKQYTALKPPPPSIAEEFSAFRTSDSAPVPSTFFYPAVFTDKPQRKNTWNFFDEIPTTPNAFQGNVKTEPVAPALLTSAVSKAENPGVLKLQLDGSPRGTNLGSPPKVGLRERRKVNPNLRLSTSTNSSVGGSGSGNTPMSGATTGVSMLSDGAFARLDSVFSGASTPASANPMRRQGGYAGGSGKNIAQDLTPRTKQKFDLITPSKKETMSSAMEGLFHLYYEKTGTAPSLNPLEWPETKTRQWAQWFSSEFHLDASLFIAAGLSGRAVDTMIASTPDHFLKLWEGLAGDVCLEHWNYLKKNYANHRTQFQPSIYAESFASAIPSTAGTPPLIKHEITPSVAQSKPNVKSSPSGRRRDRNSSGRKPMTEEARKENEKKLAASLQNATGGGPIQLWHFLIEQLLDRSKQHLLAWTGNDWEFKIIEPDLVADLWGQRKNKPRMNYEKLSRGLRYYYDKSILEKTASKRYCYRFICGLDKMLDMTADQMHEHMGTSPTQPGAGREPKNHLTTAKVKAATASASAGRFASEGPTFGKTGDHVDDASNTDSAPESLQNFRSLGHRRQFEEQPPPTSWLAEQSAGGLSRSDSSLAHAAGSSQMGYATGVQQQQQQSARMAGWGSGEQLNVARSDFFGEEAVAGWLAGDAQQRGGPSGSGDYQSDAPGPYASGPY